MAQANIAFQRDSDSVSIGDRRKSISTRSVSLENLSRAIDKKREDDTSTEQKVPDVKIKSENNIYHDDDSDSYYSIKRLRERRRGEQDEDSNLSRRVKRFYKDQDELIDVYERMQNQAGENDDDMNSEEKQKRAKVQRMSNILTKVSLGVNIVCKSSFYYNQSNISMFSVYLY